MRLEVRPKIKREQLQRLGSSLSSKFLNIDYNEKSLDYYAQFGKDLLELGLFDAKDKLLAKVTCLTKDFYEKDKGPVKVLLLSDIRTVQAREALVGWADLILPKILELKKETSSDYALFYLSRMEKGFFDFFIRPRRIRKEQVRFSHLRKISLEVVQGKKLISDDPLEFIEIRRAEKGDLVGLGGFIKRASLKMPLSRKLTEEGLLSEIAKWKDFDLENLALAFDSKNNIVGSLGRYDLTARAQTSFKINDSTDSAFLALQSFLSMGSWVMDLRPVLSRASHKINLFTHMYFNNSDIFYSMICWWLKETKKERPLFLYPYYDGDLKTLPSESLFSTGFRGDLYLIHEDKAQPPQLLKPSLFSESIDIDLPLLL